MATKIATNFLFQTLTAHLFLHHDARMIIPLGFPSPSTLTAAAQCLGWGLGGGGVCCYKFPGRWGISKMNKGRRHFQKSQYCTCNLALLDVLTLQWGAFAIPTVGILCSLRGKIIKLMTSETVANVILPNLSMQKLKLPYSMTSSHTSEVLLGVRL